MSHFMQMLQQILFDLDNRFQEFAINNQSIQEIVSRTHEDNVLNHQHMQDQLHLQHTIHETMNH